MLFVKKTTHIRLELLIESRREIPLKDRVLHPREVAPPYFQCLAYSLLSHIVDHENKHGYHLDTKGS
jgi:hypothetical protein